MRSQDICIRFVGDADICRMLEMCHSECGGTSGLHSSGTRFQPPSDLLRPSQCSGNSWRLDLTEHLSKITEVLSFKITQVPKVNFLFCQCTVLFLLYVILAIPHASKATYNALYLLNTLTFYFEELDRNVVE